MKKILFLLLSTVAMYGQVPADATPLENIQITNNKTSTTATKVNVQENDGTINTISKSDLVNVVEANDVPTLPLVGEVGKIYVVKNVNKIYRWNGTFYQKLEGSDISGKEDIANKQNSLSVDGSNTKYPTVTAVNTGLGLKENILNNPITGVGSQNNVNTYALQDGTVLYHSTKWFVPSGAVSTIGATVTSVGTQFTSAMVGAKLTINGEWRVITAYTNSTTVITQSGYSQNYSNVVSGNWGVYPRGMFLTANGNLSIVQGVQDGGATTGSNLLTFGSGIPTSAYGIMGGTNKACWFGNGHLSDDSIIRFANTSTSQPFSNNNDLGIRRNSSGVLEIYNGITPTGLEANRRDLLARNLFGSKVLIGSIVDDNVNQGQYTGTVSSGTTALNNTQPTANNQLTRKDYVDTGLALKANLASPALTGTPTAPTATAGTNTTQVATTAFVAGGLATKENAFSKNTAFNKNFGTTAGTVVEGNYPPAKDGTGAFGTWGINISGNANSASGLGVYSWDPTIASTGLDFLFGRTGSNSIKIIDSENVKSWLGLGSMAYQPADPFVYSYKGVLNYDNNADDISSNGVYINNTGNGYNNSNFASDISVLSVIGNNSNYGQVQQDFDWNGNQRYRVRLGESGFGMWQRVLVEADLDAIATKDFVVANRITIPHLKFSELDKTVWNNGKGDFSDNTSFGDKALWKNTIGRNNTANGFHTLLQNQEGTSNTANGMSALKSNRDGSFNTANGAMALLSNENGSLNTANGYQALRENINGSSNTANGYQAGHLAYPYVYNTSSNASVFLGAYTKPLGDNQENQIVIGYAAVGAGSNTFTLGNTDIKKTVIGGVIQKRTLDAAPSSATDTGTLGEIRVTSSHIYVCIATNTWVRSELASW